MMACGGWGLPAGAQDTLEGGLEGAMNRGQAALEAGDFAAARDAFTEAIELSEAGFSHYGPYIGRAIALAELDEKEKAFADFQKAQQAATNMGQTLPPVALFARGSFLLDLGGQYLGAALPDLQAAYESDPDNLEYAFKLGKAYALVSPQAPQAGPQAEELLTKFIDANPDHPEALRLRGQAYAAMRKFDEAMADTGRSLELEPDKHEAHFAMGILQFQQENYEESLKSLREAILKYKPEEGDDSGMPFAQAFLIMASVQEEAGKASDDPEYKREMYQDAVETCNLLMKNLPEKAAQTPAVRQQALFRRGVNERLLGQYSDAMMSLTESIELNPEFAEGYFRRAIVYTEMQEERLALRDLQAAQALKFEDARAYLWEGITYAQMGRYRDAIRSYNKAISFSNRYVDAFRNRGHAYFQEGEYQQAIDNFNECIRLQPAEPSHFYKRAICHLRLEEPELAERSLVGAVTVNPRYQPALAQLVELYAASGQRELAAQYREKLEAAQLPPAPKVDSQE